MASNELRRIIMRLTGIGITFFTAFFLAVCLFPSGPAPGDDTYANVFKPLDGKWKGDFHVYSLSTKNLKKNSIPRLDTIDLHAFKLLPLKLEQMISVEQTYTSKSPFLQRVVIIDTYTRKDGSRKVVRSTGVNKMVSGKLVCIVDKPGEQVIHTGKTEGPHTIIWKRQIKHPFKKEYFRETVEKDQYTIIGYGYYGDDDPSQPPRTWFFGIYFRR
jgi:hypothetical protein